ncbi:MAG: cell envelope integrity protein CreD [Opitutae bacterium]|nr:cell envelope integrity protein CreD [Opitutae bacterium]
MTPKLSDPSSGSSITIKLIVITLLVLGLLVLTIPLFFIIDERENRREEVTREISSKWGLDQTVIGPIISVPYHVEVSNHSNGRTRTTRETRYLHILPDNLVIKGTVIPETRYRGIYESVVYKSRLSISGKFFSPDWDMTRVPQENLLKDKAWLTIGISDVRGIRENSKIIFDGKELETLPGLPTQEVISTGVMAMIDLSEINVSSEFLIDMHLDGSSTLAFSPIGKTTSVSVDSPWSSPSFDGAFLPLVKELSENGFKANWKVLHLNRAIPQSWTGSAPKGDDSEDWKKDRQVEPAKSLSGPKNILGDSAFGIRFYLPTDVYQKTNRMAKYAILFLGFAFAAFFFSEILQKARVHPIQYLLVGFAILIFYLLLLSLSEQFGFDLAYWVATGGVIFLISGYAQAILRSQRLGLTVGVVLALLYGYLYVILQLENFALLMGSLGLFATLAAAMYFTRKIDWYALRLNSPSPPNQSD